MKILYTLYKYIIKYYFNKVDSNIEIMAQYRIWVDENEYGKEKFNEIKRLIIKESNLKLKKLTSVNRIISDDEHIINGLKNINFYN